MTFAGTIFSEGAPDPARLRAIENAAAWTRTRFKLAPDSPVLVSEVACVMPGCPPLETAIAFWTADGKRHQFKLAKPLRELIYDDIGWLIASSGDHVGASMWDCC
jgi:nitrate reductase delta subunit